MIHNYNELPIGKYLRIREAAQKEDNDLGIVAVLHDKTEDELLNMPLTEYATLRDAASFLLYEPAKAKKVEKVYQCGDFALTPRIEPKKVTTAQYIDFKEYAAAGGSILDYLSALLVPEGKSYGDGYDTDLVRTAIGETLPVPEALALCDFFTMRLGRLTRDTLTSSLRRMKRSARTRTTRKEIAAAMRSVASGDGLRMWMQSANSPAAVGAKYIR